MGDPKRILYISGVTLNARRSIDSYSPLWSVTPLQGWRVDESRSYRDGFGVPQSWASCLGPWQLLGNIGNCWNVEPDIRPELTVRPVGPISATSGFWTRRPWESRCFVAGVRVRGQDGCSLGCSKQRELSPKEALDGKCIRSQVRGSKNHPWVVPVKTIMLSPLKHRADPLGVKSCLAHPSLPRPVAKWARPGFAV